MNDCWICGWQAPTAANLNDHLMTVHPGKENKPPEREYGQYSGFSLYYSKNPDDFAPDNG